MCQMRVVLQKDGGQETILEAVARLVVTAEGVTVNALFETPLSMPGTVVKEIDFLDGKVVLMPASDAGLRSGGGQCQP